MGRSVKGGMRWTKCERKEARAALGSRAKGEPKTNRARRDYAMPQHGAVGYVQIGGSWTRKTWVTAKEREQHGDWVARSGARQRDSQSTGPLVGKQRQGVTYEVIITTRNSLGTSETGERRVGANGTAAKTNRHGQVWGTNVLVVSLCLCSQGCVDETVFGTLGGVLVEGRRQKSRPGTVLACRRLPCPRLSECHSVVRLLCPKDSPEDPDNPDDPDDSAKSCWEGVPG